MPRRPQRKGVLNDVDGVARAAVEKVPDLPIRHLELLHMIFANRNLGMRKYKNILKSLGSFSVVWKPGFATKSLYCSMLEIFLFSGKVISDDPERFHAITLDEDVLAARARMNAIGDFQESRVHAVGRHGCSFDSGEARGEVVRVRDTNLEGSFSVV